MHQFLPSLMERHLTLLAGFKNLVVSLAHFSPLIRNPLEIRGVAFLIHKVFTRQQLCSLLEARG